MNKYVLAYILLLCSNVIFGFSFLFSKIALNYASPIQLIALRFWLAFAIMNLLLLTGKFKLELKGKPVKKLVMTGFIQPVIYFLCETYGIQLTSSSFAGVMIGLLPILGLISGVIFMNEKISKVQVACVLLSVTGVYFTTFGGEVRVSILGVILLFGAVLSAAAFSTLSASMADKFSAFERTYMMFAVGTSVFTLLALADTGLDIKLLVSPFAHADFIVGWIYLGFCSSVLAFFFTNYGLNYVPVSSQTLLANFTTVVSIIAGVLILKEQFTFPQFIGIVMILISVFGVTLFKKKTDAE